MSNYKFSDNSLHQLETCHLDLQTVFKEVIKKVDCTIVEGYRQKYKQNLYFKQNRSRVKFPNSDHNKIPSLAVDVIPYINGKGSWHPHHCIYFAGCAMTIARRLGIPLGWGGNWDLDEEIMTDQDFQDLAHYFLIQANGEHY